MRKLKLSERKKRWLIGKLNSEVANYEYWVIARITGCESEHEPFLPGSLPYDVTFRSGRVKKMAVYYKSRFWDIRKYVIEALQERYAKLPAFREEITEDQDWGVLAAFGKILDAKASEAANDIRRGTGSSIPRSRLVIIKRFHKLS